MKFHTRVSMLAMSSLMLSAPAWAVKVGEKAPDFSIQGIEGKKPDLKTFSLANAKGKYVVLEWHNQGCPYVVKHYDTGNMQKLQSASAAPDVLWYTVISSKKGKQGFVAPEEEIEYLEKQKASPSAVLFDKDQKMAKAYEAKTTPHMIIIDPAGKVIYNGAIDDKSTAEKSDVEGAKQYVLNALKEHKSTKKVTLASTKPYGCSVKY